ncbi:hypothetical protein NKI25_16635 [Mesorhizobium sp. M0808]|uniref:hypothetical protein n=1 Tax=Mesorhizobium sp. M0808 TaxID=2957002 RepID=UPI003334DCCA
MVGDDDDIDGEELEQALPDASLSTRFAAPQKTVDDGIPADLHQKYEFFSYKNAVVILSETRPDEWAEIMSRNTVTVHFCRVGLAARAPCPPSPPPHPQHRAGEPKCFHVRRLCVPQD